MGKKKDKQTSEAGDAGELLTAGLDNLGAPTLAAPEAAAVPLGRCEQCGRQLRIMRAGKSKWAICSGAFSAECSSSLVPLDTQLEAAIKTIHLPLATKCTHVIARRVADTPFFTQDIYQIDGHPGELYRRVSLAEKNGKGPAVKAKTGPGEMVGLTPWLEGELDLGMERIKRD